MPVNAALESSTFGTNILQKVLGRLRWVTEHFENVTAQLQGGLERFRNHFHRTMGQ